MVVQDLPPEQILTPEQDMHGDADAGVAELGAEVVEHGVVDILSLLLAS